MSLTKNLKTIVIKFVNGLNISVRVTTMNAELKKLLNESGKSLKQVAQRLIEENKSLKGTVSKNQEALLEQANVQRQER